VQEPVTLLRKLHYFVGKLESLIDKHNQDQMVGYYSELEKAIDDYSSFITNSENEIEEQETIKYVYKLYPEGPITYTMIRHLLNHWKEMMKILTHVNIQSLNLLKFMVDDNYSLQSSSIA